MWFRGLWKFPTSKGRPVKPHSTENQVYLLVGIGFPRPFLHQELYTRSLELSRGNFRHRFASFFISDLALKLSKYFGNFLIFLSP